MTKIIRPSAQRATGDDADMELQDSKSTGQNPEEQSSELINLNLQPSCQSEQRANEGSQNGTTHNSGEDKASAEFN